MTTTGPRSGAPLRALLFDFDGTMMDTEQAHFAAWQHIFELHGAQIDEHDWAGVVGTVGSDFDPMALLQRRTSVALDAEQVTARREERFRTLYRQLELRPGIDALAQSARDAGLAVAIVTNAEPEWVELHLDRLGELDQWPHMFAAGVDPERAKPSPVLYLEALAKLGVSAEEAIAIEDSPIGIRAAQAAGLRCLAYPHPLTSVLDLSAADAIVDSLEGITLAQLESLVG
ncbi:MAG: HAD-IA family hydrolase [Nocardioides sp.]|uniref:HAD family hydrolase n=1 Tax=Nocardioides sp. TaxID=35761 RepID=UPI0039E49BCC